MALQPLRQGVGQRPYDGFALVLLSERGEVRIEEFVGLADWDLNADPVSGGRQSSCSETVRAKPGNDSFLGRGVGRDHVLDLRCKQFIVKMPCKKHDRGHTSCLVKC